MIWPLIGLFGLNSFKKQNDAETISVTSKCPYKHEKLSKFDNFEVWPLLWPSKFFWPFYIFPGHFKVQIVEINQN